MPSGTSNLAMLAAEGSSGELARAIHARFAGGVVLSLDPRPHRLGGQLIDQLLCFTLGAINLRCPPCVDGIDFLVADSRFSFPEPRAVDRRAQGISEVPPEPAVDLTFDLRLSPGLFGDQPGRRGSQQALGLGRLDVAFLDGTDLNTEAGGCILTVTEPALTGLVLAAAFAGLDQPFGRLGLLRPGCARVRRSAIPADARRCWRRPVPGPRASTHPPS